MARKRVPEVGEELLHGAQLQGDNTQSGGEKLLSTIDDAIKASLQEKGYLYYVVQCSRDEQGGIECVIMDNESSKEPDIRDVFVRYHYSGAFGIYIVTATVAD